MPKPNLAPIYERLNGAPAYHPMTAETFADWAMEAGDLITVSRDGNSYTSPVSTSRMVWKGSQQISIDSTGSKEREAISRISRRKYGRGSGSLTNNNYIYHEITDDSGLLKTTIQATESVIRTDIRNDYKGLSTTIEQTASSLRSLIISSKSSTIYPQYDDPNDGTRQLAEGDVWIQTNGIRSWDEFFNADVSWDYSSGWNWQELRGSLIKVWKNGKWEEVSDEQTVATLTDIDQTNEHIALVARSVDTLDGTVRANEARFEVRANQIESTVYDRTNGLDSKIEQTASSIRMEVNNSVEGLNTSITQTASSIRAEVNNSYKGLSTSITQTASSIRSEVSNSVDGLSTSITQTASSIRAEVSNSYKGLSTSITQSASSIRSEVSNSVKGLSTSITQTASSIRSEVSNSVKGLSTSITQTASSIRAEVSNSYKGLSTTITQTESTLRSLIVDSKSSTVYPQYDDPVSDGYVMKEGDVWIQTNSIRSWNEFFNADVSWDYSSEWNWQEMRGSLIKVWKNGKWEEVSDEQTVATLTDIDQTNDHIALVARSVDTLDGKVRANEARFEVRANQIESTVYDRTNGLDSKISQTASSIRMEVNNSVEGLSTSITQTASSIRAEVSNSYKGLSTSITQSASSIRSEVSNSVKGLSTSITQTASSIRSEVSNSYKGLSTSITQTASSIRSEVSNSYKGLSTSITQTASSIRSEVSDSVSGLNTSITQTASSIRSEVSDSVSGLNTSITQTASSIRAEVSNSYRGLSSYIETQEDRISLVVDGSGTGAKIKPASIVSAINNGESTVIISASHVNLDGLVKATDLTTDYFKSKIAAISRVDVKALSASGMMYGTNIIASGYINANSFNITSDGTSTNINKLFVASLSLTQSGNTYTLKSKNGAGTETTIGSFSRAVTSWSVGGGSGNVNVTANPQDQTKSVPVSIGGSTNIISNGTYTYKVYYENDDGDDVETGATKSVEVAIPTPKDCAIYDVDSAKVTSMRITEETRLWAGYKIGEEGQETEVWGGSVVLTPGLLQSKTAYANGTYKPDSGVYGLSQVIVNVQPTITNLAVYDEDDNKVSAVTITKATTFWAGCEVNDGGITYGATITVTPPNHPDKGSGWVCSIEELASGVKIVRLVKTFTPGASIPFTHNSNYHLYT